MKHSFAYEMPWKLTFEDVTKENIKSEARDNLLRWLNHRLERELRGHTQRLLWAAKQKV